MLDQLKLLRGDNLYINQYITVKNPTLNEIIEYGEENYFNSIELFCLKPYDLMVQLYDSGIDYRDIDNYEVFLMLFQSALFSNDENNIHIKGLKWFIGDYNFSIYKNNQSNMNVLYDEKKNIIIDKLIYMRISHFIKQINNIPEKNEYNLANMSAIRLMVEDKRREYNRLKNKPKVFASLLENIISALIWDSNCSLKINDVWDLHISQIYNGLNRISCNKNYDQIMNAIYTGNIDQKTIDVNTIHWAKKIKI